MLKDNRLPAPVGAVAYNSPKPRYLGSCAYFPRAITQDRNYPAADYCTKMRVTVRAEDFHYLLYLRFRGAEGTMSSSWQFNRAVPVPVLSLLSGADRMPQV